MKIDDKTRIKKVILKHPEIMSPDAESLIKKEYEDLLKMENNLAKLRMEAIKLEGEYKKKRKAFYNISDLFELVFETREIDYKTEECNLVVSNSSDARNSNYGN